jgi:transposase-like protein
MGSDRLDCGEDRVYGADPSHLGGPGREGPGPSSWLHDRRTRADQALERENRELRQANEILRKASAYFAQAELDRRFRP